VLRHASAGEKRPNPILDRKRPLDKEGKQQCLIIGSYLNALRVNIDLIVSSPLKRALQTASLVGTELGYESTIQLSEELAPGGSVEAFHKLVAKLGVYENVLIIGHNPSLATFLGSLVTTGPESDPCPLYERCEKVAPEDFTEVVCFLPDGPQLKLRTCPAGQQLE
jgi:phosphohistidine phosphatase